MSLDIAKHGVPSWPIPRKIHLMIMWNDVESNSQHFARGGHTPLCFVTTCDKTLHTFRGIQYL